MAYITLQTSTFPAVEILIHIHLRQADIIYLAGGFFIESVFFFLRN